MEIKVKKDIRKYEEEFFMGMNLRKTIFMVAMIALALVTGFCLRKYVSFEAISWLIPIILIPMFFIGFKTYQGLPFEKFFIVYVRHKFFEVKKLSFGNDKLKINIREGNKHGKKKEK